MDNKDRIIKNLAKLIESFGGRHNHLAKFLIDNSALNSGFIKSVKNSKILNEDRDISGMIPVFRSIEEMEKFYLSLIDGELIEDYLEINIRLNILIDSEKYEEAAKLRDYMKRNNIKRI